MMHAPTQKETNASASKNVRTSGKSSSLDFTISSKNKSPAEKGPKESRKKNPNLSSVANDVSTEGEKTNIDKQLRKFVASILKEVGSNVLPDVPTSLETENRPTGVSSRKVDGCVSEHIAHKRRTKKKGDVVVNVNGLISNEEPNAKSLAPNIANRLKRRK